MRVTVDDLWRILLPKEARTQLEIKEGDKLEIHVRDNEIAIIKAES